jgi:hypothetical protein
MISAPHRPGSRARRHAHGIGGRFVGSLHLEWTGTGAGGGPAGMSVELHFGWVLGALAVQGAWIAPGRGQTGKSRPPLAFRGSTIRFYDPVIDTWRSAWIEPVNGQVRRFIGRATGDGIVLLNEACHFDEQMPATRINPAMSASRGLLSLPSAASFASCGNAR